MFNSHCKTLSKCYRVPEIKKQTKQDCDETYIKNIKTECEKITSANKKDLCLISAKWHEDFIENYLDDIYEKLNDLKLVRLMYYEDSGCIVEENFKIITDIGCFEKTALANWYLIRLDDGKFALKNYVSENCI